jgi:arylsulfatase A-like enzyme
MGLFMMKHHSFLIAFVWLVVSYCSSFAGDRPRNIVIIYGDDVGIGDLACYGASRVATPNVDRLASEGLRLTSGYATSSTCTPSRFALLSGEYPWRRENTKILPGDAALIIDCSRATLPSMLKKAGYTTGVVGKWHLGLGAQGAKLDWNQPISPGPLETGFDYSFIMAATGDRVPCVYVENHSVVGLDPKDPLRVDYKTPFPGELDGVRDRTKLKMDWSHGHNMAVVNGIGRIGYFTGGKSAQWVDEDMADTFTKRAVDFIERERDRPFFLFFATHDIHVPRVPHQRFVGKTSMGPRGDAIAEFDWSVGEVLASLEKHGLTRDTLVILSSDNGPVIDDGYKDQAVEKLGDHKPAAQFRGGKYSRFEAGTRVPFLVRWPERVKPGVSDAMVSQIDLLATFAALSKQKLSEVDAVDSLEMSAALLGDSPHGREYVIEHSQRLALRQGNWKYIEPAPGAEPFKPLTGTETANTHEPQLYDISNDALEHKNVAAAHSDRVKAMAEKLAALQKTTRTRP